MEMARRRRTGGEGITISKENEKKRKSGGPSREERQGDKGKGEK